MEIWNVLLELSPPFLLGLFIAGLLHTYLPRGLIRRRLNRADVRSVFEAVMIGAPMPLCSCGVAPTAIGLRNDGASKGAATGFLISTPQTGVDSILVSASFLGWPFAVFKVAAAFITGMIGGILVNFTGKSETAPESPSSSTDDEGVKNRNFLEVFRFAFYDLLATIDFYLIIGIAAAALVTISMPDGYLTELSWVQGIGGMFIALAISLPLYVCTTGSVPIAASLIAAGMPTGTALVFLMAGPATNIATMTMIYRAMGGRVLAIYLGTVSVMSMLFGLAFGWVVGTGPVVGDMPRGHGSGPIATACAIGLIVLLTYLLGRRVIRRLKSSTTLKGESGLELVLKVDGMTCMHCVANVKKALEALSNVEEAALDLQSGLVSVTGNDLDKPTLSCAIEKAGYKVVT